MSSTGSRTETAPASTTPRAPWAPRLTALLPLLSALLLALATPGNGGGVWAFASLCALLPWAVFLGRTGRGWVVPIYLAGAVHTAAYSWSIRHVPGPGFWILTLVGPLVYWLPGAVLFRRLAVWVSPTWATALAWTANEWLRAHFLSVPYPHAQLCHALYQQPDLLAGAAWWGETGLTLVLAAVSGLGASVFGHWAVARPRRGALVRDGVLVAALLLVPVLLAPHRSGAQPGKPVQFLAVQPGIVGEALVTEGVQTAILKALVGPTSDAVASSRTRPDLIVWPESALAMSLHGDPREQQFLAELGRTLLARDRYLLLGTQADAPDAVTAGNARRHRVVAVLLDQAGAVLGSHEKLLLVPGGECIPFLDALPEGLQRAVLEFIGSLSGQRMVPTMVPGRSRPPLELPGKAVPFAAMLCFDNAFPEPFAAQAQAGAQFFCVLSNEAWYQGGNELDQLEACTVLRALETGRPILRVTMDGVTCLVASDGSVTARASHEGRDRRVAATLSGVLLPDRGFRLATWLGPWLGPLSWAVSLALLALGWRMRTT